MINNIKQWLEPPVFPNDESKTRRAGLLNAALLNQLTILPILFLGNMLGGKTSFAVLAAVLAAFLLCLAFRKWMRRGAIQESGIGFLAVGFSLVTATLANLGTIRAPSAAAYILLVIAAGLLFDLRGILVSAALSSVCIVVLILAENARLLPRPDYSVTVTQWVTYSTIFAWTGSLVYSAIQMLREAESRWQFALEGSGEGMWDWDTQTNKVFFSRQWKAILGFSENEVGDTLAERDKRLHPDDREYISNEIHKHFAGETPVYVSEHRVMCKDGTYKWILERGKVISWSEDGKPGRIIGTITDITERKRMEEAEREQRILAEALGNSAAALNSALQVKEVLERILDNIGRVVGHDAVSVFLLDPTRQFAEVVAHRDVREKPQEMKDIRFEVSQMRNLLDMQTTGAPVVISETRVYDGWVATPSSAWIRSSLGVPIRAKGQVIGFLSIVSATPNVFAARDAERAQAFADHAGLAIENARLYEEVRTLALTDGLTGLFNRAFFETELERMELGRAFPMSIVVADLDNMKSTNDRLGHPMGDELIKSAAILMRETFRTEDTLARIGGDEFAVLLPNTGTTAVAQILERIQAKLAEHNATHSNLPIQLSLGAATTERGHLMKMFRAADQNMYRDKARRKSSHPNPPGRRP